MRLRSLPVLLLLLLPFLSGAKVPAARQPIFRNLPEHIYQDLGTAGRPRWLPGPYFAARYADHPVLPGVIELFYAQDYHTAFRALEDGDQVLEPETHAWRALVCYRQGNFAESVASARRALALDPRTGLAHLALGLSYNTQRNPFDWASDDSASLHMRRATELAPTLPSAWQSLWVGGVKAGDRDQEQAALAGLWQNRCLTPGLLEHSRWVLNSLPEEAVFLTNGDNDTYPLLVLQQEEGLRSDVAVINISLLNDPAYAKNVSRRAGLPWPRTDKDLERVPHARAADGSRRSRAVRIVDEWAQMARLGEMLRPLTWGLTVQPRNLPAGLDQECLLLGGAHRYAPDVVGPLVDYGGVLASFRGIDLKKMMGNFVSPMETSPVRASGGNNLAGNPIAVYLRYAYQGLAEGHEGRARTGLAGAGILMNHGDLQEAFEGRLQELGGILWEVENGDGGE